MIEDPRKADTPKIHNSKAAKPIGGPHTFGDGCFPKQVVSSVAHIYTSWVHFYFTMNCGALGKPEKPSTPCGLGGSRWPEQSQLQMNNIVSQACVKKGVLEMWPCFTCENALHQCTPIGFKNALWWTIVEKNQRWLRWMIQLVECWWPERPPWMIIKRVFLRKCWARLANEIKYYRWSSKSGRFSINPSCID